MFVKNWNDGLLSAFIYLWSLSTIALDLSCAIPLLYTIDVFLDIWSYQSISLALSLLATKRGSASNGLI